MSIPPTRQRVEAWKHDAQKTTPLSRGDSSPVDVHHLVEVHTHGSVSEKDPRMPSGDHAETGGGVFYVSKPLGASSARASARRETRYLRKLPGIIDCLQDLFTSSAALEVFTPVVEAEVLCRVHLAAHEWIAELIQHADFSDRVPQIALSVWADGNRLRCLIADNSEGFDRHAEPTGDLASVWETLPEQGMRWLFIHACADQVVYRPFGNQGYGLEFSIG